MKFKLVRTKTFKRSFKKLNLSDSDLQIFIEIINGLTLDIKYKDHQLKGELKEFRECHIKPDLLLIYRIKNNQLELIDIGSHSELFK